MMTWRGGGGREGKGGRGGYVDGSTSKQRARGSTCRAAQQRQCPARRAIRLLARPPIHLVIFAARRQQRLPDALLGAV